ncbi:hypothetical protein OF83DRAFT_98452 [Amylostereum chailletii]|nr:hypothetical protein OF83DRAFT_98452 [Amylostereum chailletii]
MSAVFMSMALSVPLVLYASYAFFGKPVSNALCQTLALQFCGILIIGSSITSTIPLRLISLPVVSSIALISLEAVYRIPLASFNDVNITFFSTGLVVQVAIIVHSLVTSQELWPPIFAHSILSTTFILILKAVADLLAMNIIFVHDILVERVLYALAITIALPAMTTDYGLQSLRVFLGCVISAWAAITFILSPPTVNGESLLSTTAPSRKRRAICAGVFTFLALIAGWDTVPRERSHSSEVHSWDPALAQPRHCVRRPLSIPPLYPPSERAYRKFDDVLLVVFFSHARYDANLDHYRAVYADYFPNIVFVGPGTRENAGFRHSYDVLVDTYQSDEDLSDDKNYKMAGRMAHHMLYTALREYPCYKGYLWAPFDTFLNVPRLEQFDQSLFWYHSPFARYVHNVALGDLEANANPARHPQPARISPDLTVNLTDGWRGWGPDWWWGDPRVGVSECMPAFLKAPTDQRARLASYFNGEKRFIGGSVDTLYIPGHHREKLMETLGLFLETNCFFEIALPTAVHLVVPAEEDILYVDHHWIWYPPFDGEFVRKQWKVGLEVDTFHTFHWGDVDQDGVWKARPELIDDTRMLLKQSAARQNTKLPLHEER